MAPKRSGSPLHKAKLGLTFIGVSVLAGVLTAGLALPAVGGLGLTAKNTAESFNDMPADFKAPTLSQASYIYDAKGGLIAKVYDRDRTIVPLDDIAPVMRQAQVDIEDARFYQHGAIDFKGVLRALTNNVETGDVQGASTLTQQYVKNVFVEEAGDDKQKFLEATRQTSGRKIQELKYAIQVEKELTKNQILNNYLNITYYANQAYGIEAAANRYFSTHAKNLTLPQAALLAGLVQNPTAYDPIAHPQAAKDRRNTVLQRMASLKHITEAQAKQAMAKPLGLKYTAPKNGCITAKAGMGFFCDYVRNVIKTDPAFGKTKAARAAVLSRGGLNIYTTLDPVAQEASRNAVNKRAHASDPVANAITMVQPGTGKILAMAQSRPYGLSTGKHQTQLNFNAGVPLSASNGQLVGSTFKAILAAAALENGVPPTQVLPAPYSMEYPTMSTCTGPYVKDGTPVRNESHSEVGPMTMSEAMNKSVNTYFVQLEEKVGLCAMQKMAQSLGLGTQATGKKLETVPSMVLGTNNYSPLQMANAYATFANNGVYCAPVAITSVTYNDKRLNVPKADCRAAMSETTAKTLNQLLLGVTEDGTGTRAGLTNGWDSAGKTGTTDDPPPHGDGVGPSNAWFVGYTKTISAAVWLGDPTQKRDLDNMTIGGEPFSVVQGANGPAPAWKEAVTAALADQSPVPLDTVFIPKPQPPKPPQDQNNGGGQQTPGAGQPQNPGGGQPGAGPGGGIQLPPIFSGGGNGKPGRGGH